jgi:hypothetical protein
MLGLLMLLAAVTPPPAAAPQPGEYRQVEPATNKPLSVGSRLVIVAGKGGKLGFSIDAVRALDSAQGFVAGLLPRAALPLTWSQSVPSGNCRLRFEAVPHGYRISQDVAFGDCGFSAGVTADGLYLREPETPPKG